MTVAPGEPLFAYLERRERELLNLGAALRGDLLAVEEELAHVQSAKRQIGQFGSVDRERLGVPGPQKSTTRLGQVTATSSFGNSPIADKSTYTIKEMVLRALHTNLAENGATISEIRQFINDVYDREVSSTSLSPQLSRLKFDGLLKQKDGDRWYLTNKGRDRARYLIMYDHPTSRAAVIKELQDDETPKEDTLRLTVAKGFKSTSQRFIEGMDLEFKDQAELDTFKQSLAPLTFEHLLHQGFLKPKD